MRSLVFLMVLVFISFGHFGQADSAKLFHKLDSTISQFDKLECSNPEKVSTCLHVTQIYLALGNQVDAYSYLDHAGELANALKSSAKKGELLLNVSATYFSNFGEYDKALVYADHGKKTYLEVNDTTGICRAYFFLGYFSVITNKENEGINFFKEGLSFAEGNPVETGSFLLRISETYYESDQKDSAELYYEKSVEFKEFIDEFSFNFNSINHYNYIGDYAKTEQILEEALAHYINGDDKERVAYIYALMVKQYSETGQNEKALKTGEEGVKYAQEYHLEKELHDVLSFYLPLLEKEKSWEELYKLSKVFWDIEKKKISDAEQNAQLKKEIDLNVAQIKEQDLINEKNALELEKSNLELEQGKRIQLYFVVIFVLVGIGLVFVFLAYKRIKKDNAIINNQKLEVEKKNLEISDQKSQVEEKNKEITDSIHYAKRLQNAILPDLKDIKANLKDSFVLYIPKDIVAGDFYWFEYHNGLIYIAAADCTGHGVPGAMVSVVCSNALSKSLLEDGCVYPNEILDRTREIVVSQFAKGSEEVKDGMDISLCAYDPNSGKLHWAGANNPLWILSKNGEIREIKADKQPIGRHAVEQPFTNHTIEVMEEDRFYLFSDGFQDQFGGEKQKKFKTKNLKDMIIQYASLSMDNQGSTFENALQEWKGDLEQMDDICMMGLQFK
ncbi:MAG: SpoIIE family protein phosphatase [Flavobacteriales bacterium]|nr:SpoIIE family protein phosphatase [Flavobacteriales bacterium]